MAYSVEVLCRPEIAAGFRQAGLAPLEAARPREGAERLLERARDPLCGVVLVEDSFWAALTPAERRGLERRSLPMIVPFPGPTWAKPAAAPEAYLVELLRQAIGYRVRLP